MAFREVRVFEVREVLRLFLRGEGLRSTERLVGGGPQDGPPLSQRAAGELGLVQDSGEEQLTDAFVGLVVDKVRPCRRDGRVRRGNGWSLTTS